MKNVLYILNYAGKAGTERYVLSLIEKLNNKRIKAYFVYNQPGLLVDRITSLGVKTFQINMRNPFDIKAAYEVGCLCKKLDIDIIHAQYMRENYISILSKVIYPKVKVIYTSHFILKNNNLVRFTNLLFTKFQSYVIAVCNKGKEMLISNKMDKNKITVIFNGVDLAFWGTNKKATIREELGIDNDTFVILCSSRFANDKGHKFLIQSIAELKKTTTFKFKVVLSNDGPLLEECKSQARQLNLEDCIVFTGFRTDVKNLLDGSNLYINCSEHEALSFAIIEALACGKPVIVTDMAGNGDIVNDNTKCGMLVKYNDVPMLANAISKLMNDVNLYKELSENAFRAAESNFNLDKVVQQTYEIYEKVTRI